MGRNGLALGGAGSTVVLWCQQQVWCCGDSSSLLLARQCYMGREGLAHGGAGSTVVLWWLGTRWCWVYCGAVVSSRCGAVVTVVVLCRWCCGDAAVVVCLQWQDLAIVALVGGWYGGGRRAN